MDFERNISSFWMVLFHCLIIYFQTIQAEDFYYDSGFFDESYCSMVSSSDASRRFAYSFFRMSSIVTGFRSNVLVSPLATGMSLAMITHGAIGGTKRQILGVLEQRARGSPAMVEDCLLQAYYGSRFNEQFVVVDQEMERKIKGIALMRTGSRLFGDRAYHFREDFVEATGLHGAEMDVAGFKQSPSLTTKKINSWVAKQTEGTIKQIYPEGLIENSMSLALSASLFFKGTWQTPFTNTTSGTFRIYRKKRGEKVTYMTYPSPVRHLYSKSIEAELVEIPYASPDGSNVDARLILLLPSDNTSSIAVDRSLSDDIILPLLSASPSDDIEVQIPKFTLHTQHRMRHIIRRMGARMIFISGKANLSRMVHRDPKMKPLYVGDISQESLYKVDEMGTMSNASFQPLNSNHNSTQESKKRVVRFNKPFTFLVYDKFTDTILFMGRVMDPRRS